MAWTAFSREHGYLYGRVNHVNFYSENERMRGHCPRPLLQLQKNLIGIFHPSVKEDRLHICENESNILEMNKELLFISPLGTS